MFVKFIDENTIEEAPNVIKGNGIYIANPLPETLIEHGYKPLEITEPDDYTAEGYHWEQRYVELDDKVVKTWVQVENPVQEVIEEPEETVEEPIEEPTEDPTLANGGDDLPASSESEAVPTGEGSEEQIEEQIEEPIEQGGE